MNTFYIADHRLYQLLPCVQLIVFFIRRINKDLNGIRGYLPNLWSVVKVKLHSGLLKEENIIKDGKCASR